MAWRWKGAAGVADGCGACSVRVVDCKRENQKHDETMQTQTMRMGRYGETKRSSIAKPNKKAQEKTGQDQTQPHTRVLQQHWRVLWTLSEDLKP